MIWVMNHLRKEFEQVLVVRFIYFDWRPFTKDSFFVYACYFLCFHERVNSCNTNWPCVWCLQHLWISIIDKSRKPRFTFSYKLWPWQPSNRQLFSCWFSYSSTAHQSHYPCSFLLHRITSSRYMSFWFQFRRLTRVLTYGNVRFALVQIL